MNTGSPSRPLRKDAARNRTQLLQAARDLFAERGLDATLDDVARQAGVGVGTAYRHFANKQEIAAALFAQSVDQVVADAEAALAIDDPWDAVVAYFESAAERQARDRGLHQMLTGQHSVGLAHQLLERLSFPVGRIFERARRAGVLRADADPTDSGVIAAMLGPVYDMSIATSPELWRRYLHIILDGLRATDRAPLATPALSVADLEAAMAGAKKHQSHPVGGPTVPNQRHGSGGKEEPDG